MHVIHMEPTPSPQTVKCTLNQRLPDGFRTIYSAVSSAGLSSAASSGRPPDWLASALAVEGIRSIMHTADFIAIDKLPDVEWEVVIGRLFQLPLFSGFSSAHHKHDMDRGEPVMVEEQEVRVWVQQYAGLPIQWKLVIGLREQRVAAPEAFRQLVVAVSRLGSNVVEDRVWIEWDARYGDPEAIAEELILEAPARFAMAVESAKRKLELFPAGTEPVPADSWMQQASKGVTADDAVALIESPDWKVRYQTLCLMQRQPLDETYYPLIRKLLNDPQMAVRRLAGVVLNLLPSEQVTDDLIGALSDDSAIVRRTAGDTLTDRGDLRALPAMEKLLQDPSRLVRWRAARFLYEFAGDQSLDALIAHRDDPAFEVRMQVRMALERIAGGEAAGGSVWQQMGGRNQ